MNRTLCSFVCALVLSMPAQADTLRLAVAANFTAVLEQLVTAFDPDQQHDISISSASTGVLYTQITRGAPFDVFFAADRVRPERLEAEGLILPGSRATYAIGQLALWQPGNSPQSASDLLPGRLAIANPATAPYGLAAQQVLKANNQWQPQQLVQGTNIAQTYQFVDSGNVAQGFVALSLLLQQGVPEQHWALVPSHMHAPIEQQLVRLKRSENNALAARFLQYMQTPAAQELIRQRGYGIADGTD